MKTHICDLLVVGAGLAGERAAVAAAEKGCDVIILSLVPPKRSHSSAAQGGMQASLGNCFKGYGDNTDVHFEDTVKGSDWGCDQDVARLFANTAPIAVREMSHWGVPWNRVVAGKKVLQNGMEVEDLPEKDGLITARNFGGTAKWRTCYTSDGTGHALLFTMDNVVIERKIPVHDRMEAISLIHDKETCYGAIVRDLRDGSLHTYLSKATLIATGGYGQIYGKSTNAIINEGTGTSIALDTEVVPLGNMEAVQFHPTGIIGTNILVTEGCRGDGGYLLDKDMNRFMVEYEPKKKELASRDVVSRRMQMHMKKGFGIKNPRFGEHLWLDIRHLGHKHIHTNLREVFDICQSFLNVDPVHELIPVRPTQHYSMGGIRTNIDGHAYGLKGLFAAGECACWDMHGFNRLGGNSVAETVVAGMIVGAKAGEYIQHHEVKIPTSIGKDAYNAQVDKIESLKATHGKKGENVYKIRHEMEEILHKNVFVFRNGDELQTAVNELTKLYDKVKNVTLQTNGKWASPELATAMRLPGQLRQALCISHGALNRTESRGSHYREDFPKRDDKNWLNRTLAYWPKGENKPNLNYENVVITELPPGDRGYGEATQEKK